MNNLIEIHDSSLRITRNIGRQIHMRIENNEVGILKSGKPLSSQSQGQFNFFLQKLIIAINKKFEKYSSAVSFAEAGEFNMAADLLAEEKIINCNKNCGKAHT
jgi:hypothetical protein